MDSQRRRHMLAALGLTDWQPRPGGALDPHGGVARSLDNAEAADDPDHHAATDATPVADQHATLEPPVQADIEAPADPPITETRAEPVLVGDERSAVSTMDWAQLEAWLATRDHRGAQRPVFGIGARDADVLIVGEAPGASEDEAGVPFVGRAGQLLDRMLFAIGCSRDTNVYITNICKFRPPNNRDPNAAEVAADWPVLERQIELMNPSLVVAVGRVAAQTLLDRKDSLGKMRGRLHAYPQRDLGVLVTYHPAFLLRSPGMKAKAWDDLKIIARTITDRAEASSADRPAS